MFDQLFVRPRALARQRTGPLAEERLRFLGHLAEQGLARKSLRDASHYLLVVADQLRLADRPGEAISSAEVDREAARWADRPPRPSDGKGRRRSRAYFLWHATRWLQFLGRLQRPPTPPDPCAALIGAFADYMHAERGLSPRTISSRCWTLREFLNQLGASDGSLRAITITRIDEVLQERVTRGGHARATVQTEASTLRAFFRYAEARGWCPGGLANAIRAPRVFPQEPLPAGPSWDRVQQLLRATEGDRPVDIRDRAILMLLAVYGLRAGEVVRLQLEDLDWEHELLRVTSTKTRRVRSYPLSRHVGDAVLRYLRRVRPCSDRREVFLTLRAPFRPLRHALWRVVASRLRPLGAAIPHHGPHALRHACATHLLDQGLTLKQIGDHLGHRHPDSTRIYTKVDLAGLRQVADFDLGDLL